MLLFFLTLKYPETILYLWCVFLSQGVIPLGGCVVSANENMGMPFAIVVNLEDFTVRP